MYSQANQDKIFDLYEVGKLTSNEFVDYLLQFLPKETKPKTVITAWNAMLLDLPKARLDFLSELKKKLPIYLFSNTNDLHYKCFKSNMNEVYGDDQLLENTFVHTYFSHLCQVRKPNPEAFELVMKKHGLKASRTLFIDDSIQHIEGARKIGIKAHHLVGEQIQDIITF